MAHGSLIPSVSSLASSASSACPTGSGPTTASPSPPPLSADSPDSPYGGSSSASCPISSSPPHLNRTVVTSECTEPSRLRPPSHLLVTGAAQQRRFNEFRTYFNDVRLHEALGQRPPASAYQPSTRPFPTKLPPLDYHAHFEVRKVSYNGGIRWHSAWINVSHLLGGEWIGLDEIADGIWSGTPDG